MLIIILVKDQGQVFIIRRHFFNSVVAIKICRNNEMSCALHVKLNFFDACSKAGHSLYTHAIAQSYESRWVFVETFNDEHNLPKALAEAQFVYLHMEIKSVFVYF